MNAPVDPYFQRAAASTILARAKEKLNLVRLFRHNACWKAGLPLEDTSCDVEYVPEASALKAAQAPSPPQSSDTAKTLRNMVAGAALLGLPAAGYVAGQMMKSDDTPERPAIERSEPDRSGSAYQWLEDQGEHLP